MAMIDLINNLIIAKCSSSIYYKSNHAYSVIQIGSTATRFGDMCVVSYKDYILVIDGGIGVDDARILSKYPINEMVVSHWHEDHFGYLKHSNYKGVVYHSYTNSELGAITYEDVKASRIDARFSLIDKNTDLGRNLTIFTPKIPVKDENENSCSLISIITSNFFNYFSLADTTANAFTKANFKEVFTLMERDSVPIIKLPHHGCKANNIGNMEFLPQLAKTGIYIISGHGGDGCNDTIKFILKNSKDSVVILLTQNTSSSSEIRGLMQYKDIIESGRFCVANWIKFDVDMNGCYQASLG